MSQKGLACRVIGPMGRALYESIKSRVPHGLGSPAFFVFEDRGVLKLFSEYRCVDKMKIYTIICENDAAETA